MLLKLRNNLELWGIEPPSQPGGPFNTNTPLPPELEVYSSLEPDASDFHVGQVQGSRKASSLDSLDSSCLDSLMSDS